MKTPELEPATKITAERQDMNKRSGEGEKKRKQISKAACFGFCGFVRRGSFDQNASSATRQHQRKKADTINSLIISSVLNVLL